MENNNKTTTGWQIPIDLKDRFTEFCEKIKDSRIQEECSAALYIYMYLPEKIRELAKLEVKGVPMVDSRFWTDFAKGLELGITAQLSIQQQKQAKSRKK